MQCGGGGTVACTPLGRPLCCSAVVHRGLSMPQVGALRGRAPPLSCAARRPSSRWAEGLDSPGLRWGRDGPKRRANLRPFDPSQLPKSERRRGRRGTRQRRGPSSSAEGKTRHPHGRRCGSQSKSVTVARSARPPRVRPRCSMVKTDRRVQAKVTLCGSSAVPWPRSKCGITRPRGSRYAQRSQARDNECSVTAWEVEHRAAAACEVRTTKNHASLATHAQLKRLRLTETPQICCAHAQSVLRRGSARHSSDVGSPATQHCSAVGGSTERRTTRGRPSPPTSIQRSVHGTSGCSAVVRLSLSSLFAVTLVLCSSPAPPLIRRCSLFPAPDGSRSLRCCCAGGAASHPPWSCHACSAPTWSSSGRRCARSCGARPALRRRCRSPSTAPPPSLCRRTTAAASAWSCPLTLCRGTGPSP